MATSLKTSIRAWRLFRRLTQRALADNSGLSKSQIEKLESGRIVHPAVDTLTRLTNALGTTLDGLQDQPSLLLSGHQLTGNKEAPRNLHKDDESQATLMPEELFRLAQEQGSRSRFREAIELCDRAIQGTNDGQKRARFNLYAALMLNQLGDCFAAEDRVGRVQMAFGHTASAMPVDIKIELEAIKGWLNDFKSNFSASHGKFTAVLELTKALDQDLLFTSLHKRTAHHFRAREVSAKVRASSGAWFTSSRRRQLSEVETIQLQLALSDVELANVDEQHPESIARNHGLRFQVQTLLNPHNPSHLDAALFEAGQISHLYNEYRTWKFLGSGADAYPGDLDDVAGSMRAARNRYAAIDHPTGVAHCAGLEATALQYGRADMKRLTHQLDLWTIVSAINREAWHPAHREASLHITKLATRLSEKQIEDYLESISERRVEGDGPWQDVQRLTGISMEAPSLYLRHVLGRA